MNILKDFINVKGGRGVGWGGEVANQIEPRRGWQVARAIM